MKWLLLLALLLLPSSAFAQAHMWGTQNLNIGVIDADTLAVNTTLTTDDTLGHWYLVTASITITLPEVDGSGLSACFYVDAASTTLTIDPGGSDNYIRPTNQTSPTINTGISNATTPLTGDFICLFNSKADYWYGLGRNGDWAY